MSCHCIGAWAKGTTWVVECCDSSCSQRFRETLLLWTLLFHFVAFIKRALFCPVCRSHYMWSYFTSKCHKLFEGGKSVTACRDLTVNKNNVCTFGRSPIVSFYHYQFQHYCGKSRYPISIVYSKNKVLFLFPCSLLLQQLKHVLNIYSLWAFAVRRGLKNRISIACNYTI